MTHLVLILFLLWAFPAAAAITFDAATASHSTDNDNGEPSFSFNHTTAAGSNRAAFACVTTNPADTITATYNSVSMTQIACVDSWGDSRTCAFKLAAPATGTNAFAGSFGQNVQWSAALATFQGVDQGTPFDTAVTDGAAALSISLDVTSQTNDWVLSCLGMRTDGSTTPNIANGASQNQLFDDFNGSAVNGRGTSQVSSGTTTTMTYDWSGMGFQYYGHVAVNMNAAAASTTVVRRRPIIIR